MFWFSLLLLDSFVYCFCFSFQGVLVSGVFLLLSPSPRLLENRVSLFVVLFNVFFCFGVFVSLFGCC